MEGAREVGEEPQPMFRDPSPGASPGLASALHSLALPAVPLGRGEVRTARVTSPTPLHTQELATCPRAHVSRRPGHLRGEHTHTHRSPRPGTQTETCMQIYTR